MATKKKTKKKIDPPVPENAIRIVWDRPRLYPKQLRAIFNKYRYALIEATTKSGKTVGCMTWLFEQALKGKPGNQCWWVAPTLKQAKIAFRRYCFGIRRNVRLPSNVRGDLFVANRSDMTITLFNGVQICFFSGEFPDNLYGEDVIAAVIDEASRTRQEAYFAIRSTLTATKGPLRMIGNVKGRKNWFYRMCRKAEGQEDLPDDQRTMIYTKITADDAVAAGVLDRSEIDDAREMLPETIFRELFFAEPGDDEGNPFGMKAIRACIVSSLSRKKARIYGIDLAKKKDWTVITGLDGDGTVCYLERFQKSWEDTIAFAKRVCKGVKTYVDSTGVGDPVLEAMQKRGGGSFRGYQFTQKSKQQLMEGLAVAIQQGRIRYPDGQIVNELEAFEYEYTRTGVKYSAPSGMTDDCVMSLALAVHGLRWKPINLDPKDMETVESIVYGEFSQFPGLTNGEFFATMRTLWTILTSERQFIFS